MISKKAEEEVKLQIKGYLMIAYGKGLQEIGDFNIDEEVDELFDSIDSILDKEG